MEELRLEVCKMVVRIDIIRRTCMVVGGWKRRFLK